MSSHAITPASNNSCSLTGSPIDTPGNKRQSESSFAAKAAKGGRFIFEAIGLGAITGLVIINPAVVGHLAGAMVKVGGAIKQAGGFIATQASAFSIGAVAVGVANLGDGLLSIYRGTGALQELKDIDDQLPDGSRGGEAFKALRATHRKMVVRGGLQAIVGITGATIGALVAGGLISNPYGLGAAVVVGVAVLLGVQVHKAIVRRKQAQLSEAYRAITTIQEVPACRQESGGSAAFDSQGAFGSPMTVASNPG